jgi:PTS system galactitol-specific IIB component
MLSQKLSEVLGEKGYEMESREVAPGGVSLEVQSGDYDLIAYTSPVEDVYGIPLINATGFLVGLNEDEFIDALMNVVGKLEL